MKLSANIIANRLSKKYKVTICGCQSNEMSISGPEFYMDGSSRLSQDHLYLATVEHLAHRPVIENGSVLVCIGEAPRLNYYKDHGNVILIHNKIDFFGVFQTLQEIFYVFSEFESRLLENFSKTPSIEAVLDAAYPIFEKRISILDESWQFVASVNGAPRGRARHNHSRLSLELDQLLSFLAEENLSMNRHDVFNLEVEQSNYVCANLFNSQREYMGCLYIEMGTEKIADGEIPLVEYLVRMLERAIEVSPDLMDSEGGSLKEILQCIMSELPLSNSQKLVLKNTNMHRSYHCISIHHASKLSALPVSYLCATMDTLLPESVFFEYNGTILGLVPKDVLGNGTASDCFEKKLGQMLEQMQLRIGISNVFADLYMLRTYYFQAEAALENGQIYEPGRCLYAFMDFALEEMITNSVGKLPIEAYFPDGFAKLLDHDSSVGSVSYFETLKVFLEENMSYSATSRRLYIHRSTLIERLNRIQKDLAIDLENPDQRLQIQMLMKAIAMEKQIQES